MKDRETLIAFVEAASKAYSEAIMSNGYSAITGGLRIAQFQRLFAASNGYNLLSAFSAPALRLLRRRVDQAFDYNLLIRFTHRRRQLLLKIVVDRQLHYRPHYVL